MRYKNIHLLSVLGSCTVMLAGCGGEESTPFEPVSAPDQTLPQRSGPPVETTNDMPHIQLDVAPVAEAIAELHRRAFSLPNVENRASTNSFTGTRGLWIKDGVPVAQPDVMSGREFAHIHPDGSLHTTLPPRRVKPAVDAGWAAPHPTGRAGHVMLFSPRSMAEVDVIFRLVVESYNFVTGRNVKAADFSNR